MAIVALSIVGSCFTLLVINKLNERPDAMAVAERFLAALSITL
jgi:hypothetical protein